MTPSEASRLLELPPGVTPDQLEARFLELRRKLEDKIAKAPTPGLQAKYRESLDEIIEAFEMLVLAADSSMLPVLRREQGEGSKEKGGGRTESGGPASLRAAGDGGAATPPRGRDSDFRSQVAALQPPEKKKKKSGGKEFVIVALIAVAVLAAGGWFVMKTRAENAEKARLAAEAKTEADRQAEEARQAAETERQRLAEERRLAEEEKERAAAAARSEQERQEKLIAQLRARTAELNVGLEAALRLENLAERELSDLRSEERELQRSTRSMGSPEMRRFLATVRAQERHVDELRRLLPTHPARLAKAKAEELLSAREADESARAVEAYAAALGQLHSDLENLRRRKLIIGPLALESNLASATWKLTDALGIEHSGRVPARLADVAIGSAMITFSAPGFQDVTQTVKVERDQIVMARAEFKPGTVALEVTPSHAEVVIEGAAPAADGVWQLAPGDYTAKARAEGYIPRSLRFTIKAGESQIHQLVLEEGSGPRLIFVAAKLLPRITDPAKFLAAAHKLAAAANERGDGEMLRDICGQLLARDIRYDNAGALYVLGDIVLFALAQEQKEAAVPLIARFERSFAALRFGEPLGAYSLHTLLAPMWSAAGDEVAALAAVNRAIGLMREHWVKARQKVNNDRLAEWKYDAYMKVAVILSHAGLPDAARRWESQVESSSFTLAVGAPRTYINAQFALATGLIRLNRSQEALQALRQGVNLELTNARTLDGLNQRLISLGVGAQRQQIGVNRLSFHAPLVVARRHGRDDAVQGIRDLVVQLESAGQIVEPPEADQVQAYRELAIDAVYASAAKEGSNLEDETLAKIDLPNVTPEAAADLVPALVDLWFNLSAFGLGSG